MNRQEQTISRSCLQLDLPPKHSQFIKNTKNSGYRVDGKTEVLIRD